MPLETVPDLLDDATHNALDREVEKTIKMTLNRPSDHWIDVEYACLLAAIVKRSDHMDKKYMDTEEGSGLIDTHNDLRPMLVSAWQHKSFREIRNLAILRVPEPVAESEDEIRIPHVANHDLHRKLSASYRKTFCGAALEGFYDYLTHNQKLFQDTDLQYYAKFCSIVQSSGTGKSRVLTELREKDVIVIYMNVRDKRSTTGFPLRDPIPSTILKGFPPSEADYRIICYAFFTALFDTLQKHLQTVCVTRKIKDNIMRWAREVCDVSYPPISNVRADFFDEVFERYLRVHADFAALSKKPNKHFSATVKGTSSYVDQTTDKLKELEIDESAIFSTHLRAAYDKMMASLNEIITDDSARPKLVIAVDAAQTLGPWHGKYRPADVFRRVVRTYSHFKRDDPVWVVFASTTSSVGDFLPPDEQDDSHRIAVIEQNLFPPYTMLGWDQSAVGLGNIDVEDVSRVDHIAGYGRPLWHSLKTALTWPQDVWTMASKKLCGGNDSFDPRQTSHVLAVLGQRFGLNVTFGHPDSVKHLEKGVASHLRMCLATTLNRNWRFTNYPSEPFLSCVAADVLHPPWRPEKVRIALETLLNAVNSGMIDKDQHGELGSRLLWLLSKDLFVRSRVTKVEMPCSWNEHLIDCDMIPVVDWLEFVFGPKIWDEEDMQTSTARHIFKDAYLNFSHWTCMESNLAGSKNGGELGLYEWTRRHWQRTSAVQCRHQHPFIDKVIPIYFKGGPEGASVESRMSHIFISDKARKPTSSKDSSSWIARLKPGGGDQASDASGSGSLPRIAILADLGQEPSFSVTFPERGIDDRYLHICAGGVDTSVYPFLTKRPGLAEALEDLVHHQRLPQLEKPYSEYLNGQTKFGATTFPADVEWEHGRIIPDVQDHSG